MLRAGGDVVAVPRLTLDEGAALVRAVTDGGVSQTAAAEIAERTAAGQLLNAIWFELMDDEATRRKLLERTKSLPDA